MAENIYSKWSLQLLMSGKGWTPGQIGFLLAYPNISKIGLASLGIHVIESIAASNPRYFVDTCYLPDHLDTTRLVSTHTSTPLRAFSLIGFSCAFELDYPYVTGMLQAAGILQRSKDRTRQRNSGMQVPIIIAGGVAVSSNPLPLLSFLDFIFMFDAETAIAEFLQAFTNFLEEDLSLDDWWKNYPGSKRGIIPAFMFSKGIALEEIMTRESCGWDARPLDSLVVPISQQLLDPEEPSSLGTSFLLEIGRGCGEGCRFCLIGSHQRPPRFRSMESIRHAVEQIGGPGQPFNKIALISTNVADHPDLSDICKCIIDSGYQLSIPSTKPYSDDEILQTIEASGIRTITIAPETGSERLRQVINKKVSNGEYTTMVEQLLQHGVTIIKIYLLLGLPTETAEDLDETIRFIEHLKVMTTAAGSRLSISLNPFIPKLGTPFMFHVTNYLSENFKRFKHDYQAFAARVEKACRITITTMDIKEARLQAVLSLGGVDLARVLETTGQGAVKPGSLHVPDDVIDFNLKPIGALQDQDHLPGYLENMIPVSFEYLKREWHAAHKEHTSSRCLPPDSCAGCDHVNCTIDSGT